MIKFHVTDLDSLIWYHRIESMTKKDMIARLMRTSPANAQMKMGTAWHAIMEDPPNEITTIEKDGLRFTVACDKKIILPQVREVRAKKTYMVDGDNISLTGKLDGLTGVKVTDHKLSFRPNPETYFDSFQWRAYLDIFNADVFEYIIYHGKAKGQDVTIKDVSTLCMYRYPGMAEDLKVGISELWEFAKNHVIGKEAL